MLFDILFPLGLCALTVVVSAVVALLPVRVMWAWGSGASAGALVSLLVRVRCHE